MVGSTLKCLCEGLQTKKNTPASSEALEVQGWRPKLYIKIGKFDGDMQGNR
jgi:hypothetical protein